MPTARELSGKWEPQKNGTASFYKLAFVKSIEELRETQADIS